MKKKRQNRRKLSPSWGEEKYSPPLVLRTAPHTGETKIIPIHLLQPESAATEQRKRPAA